MKALREGLFAVVSYVIVSFPFLGCCTEKVGGRVGRLEVVVAMLPNLTPTWLLQSQPVGNQTVSDTVESRGLRGL